MLLGHSGETREAPEERKEQVCPGRLKRKRSSSHSHDQRKVNSVEDYDSEHSSPDGKSTTTIAPDTAFQLGPLRNLPKELRFLVYEKVPPDEAPEIGTTCLPKKLRSISQAVRNDLDGIRPLPCTHTVFTFTWDAGLNPLDLYPAMNSRLSQPPGAHSHVYTNSQTINVAITSGGTLPTLRYHVRQCNIKGAQLLVYFIADNLERASKHREGLHRSFIAAAGVILAVYDVFFTQDPERIGARTTRLDFATQQNALAKALDLLARPNGDGKLVQGTEYTGFSKEADTGIDPKGAIFVRFKLENGPLQFTKINAILKGPTLRALLRL
jgi:hypothetical protein